jgi:hypothetical protein
LDVVLDKAARKTMTPRLHYPDYQAK